MGTSQHSVLSATVVSLSLGFLRSIGPFANRLAACKACKTIAPSCRRRFTSAGVSLRGGGDVVAEFMVLKP